MLIAFHSRGQRAGKDTAGDFVQEWCGQHGLTCQQLAFADQMKKLCALILDHGAAQERDWDAAVAVMDKLKLEGSVWWTVLPSVGVSDTEGISGRDFIINLAEGAKLLFGQDFWVRQVLPYNWAPTTDHTVITDLRFPEEANRVAECGGIVVEIVRSAAENAGGRSEVGLDPVYVDATIHNDGSLDEFRSRVSRLMDSATQG